MKWLLSLILAIFFFIPPFVHAQTPPSQQTYSQGRVTKIESSGTKDVGGKKNLYQKVRVTLLNGPEKTKEITLDYGGQILITRDQLLQEGDKVVVSKFTQPGQDAIYSISDRYRLPTILWLVLAFAGFVILLTGKKGLGSLSGMLISLGIIMLFIVPQILAGHDPLLISILGSIVIMVITIYLAHGISGKTTIAVVSTALSLFLTGLLAIFFVKIAGLSGLGSEDAYTLMQGFGETIQFQGLLLGGIIIGALGVLDDTTTTQATAIAELSEANPRLTVAELFRRGMNIGKEHITSLVNTLVLAYAGAAIGIFIYLTLGLQNQTQPWWVMVNSEVITEEIVRTLAGSIGLILAVPITTILAAFFAKNEIKIK